MDSCLDRWLLKSHPAVSRLTRTAILKWMVRNPQHGFSILILEPSRFFQSLPQAGWDSTWTLAFHPKAGWRKELNLLPGNKMASLVCSINEPISDRSQLWDILLQLSWLILTQGEDSPHLRTLAIGPDQTLRLIHLEFSLIMGDPRVLIKGTFKNLDGFKSFLRLHFF